MYLIPDNPNDATTSQPGSHHHPQIADPITQAEERQRGGRKELFIKYSGHVPLNFNSTISLARSISLHFWAQQQLISSLIPSSCCATRMSRLSYFQGILNIPSLHLISKFTERRPPPLLLLVKTSLFTPFSSSTLSIRSRETTTSVSRRVLWIPFRNRAYY